MFVRENWHVIGVVEKYT